RFRVEDGLRLVNRADIVERPLREAGDRLLQRMAKLGQCIIDARRNAWRDGPADETVALEVAQCERQHALRNAGNFAPELVETPRPLAERRDDKHGPFVADPRQQGADRPADWVGWVFHGLGTSMFLSHKFVLGAQKSAFLRGFCTWLFRVPR